MITYLYDINKNLWHTNLSIIFVLLKRAIECFYEVIDSLRITKEFYHLFNNHFF